MRREIREDILVSMANIHETCINCNIKNNCEFGKPALKVFDSIPETDDLQRVGKANAITYIWSKEEDEVSQFCPTLSVVRENIAVLSKKLESQS